MKIVLYAVVAALIACVCLAANAQDADALFLTEITAAPQNPAEGGLVTLTVQLRLAFEAHVYTEGFGFQWKEMSGLTLLNVQMPAPSKMDDPGEPGAMIEVLSTGDEAKVFFRVAGRPGESVRIAGTLGFSGCTDICFPPFSRAFLIDLGKVSAASSAPPASPAGPPVLPVPRQADAAGPGPAAPIPADLDLWLLLLKILQAFGIGFLISLTPCVYPMIGITAAVIGGAGKPGERRTGKALINSVAYVFGISITYSVIGVLTALAGAPFAQALKSGFVLVPVSIVFVVLALSMFDVITIQTPAFVQNRLSGVGRKGSGVPGKFALGLVAGVVATPCVAAPLIATLIEIATITADRGMLTGIVFGLAMLFSLAWGMGVVLVVAGVLTASVLPRSGAWMVWVKKLFGFGMIWAAVYFALPVIGEGLYDLFTALVMFAGVAFLGGLDKLTAESSFFDRLKRAAGLPVLVMAVLLLAGSLNSLTEMFPWLDCGRASSDAAVSPFRKGTLADVDRAVSSDKPAVIDFWADWCKVCKKLDRTLFSDARVIEALSRLEAIKIDYDAAPDAVRRFSVVGVPTVVFVDSAGRVRDDLRFSGELTPEEFLRRIDELNAGGR